MKVYEYFIMRDSKKVKMVTNVKKGRDLVLYKDGNKLGLRKRTIMHNKIADLIKKARIFKCKKQ
jgi:hypothetical protein